MCDTPPVAYRKMTRLAFAPNCGARGVSGSSDAASRASNSDSTPGSKMELPTSERIIARRVSGRCVPIMDLFKRIGSKLTSWDWLP